MLKPTQDLCLRLGSSKIDHFQAISNIVFLLKTKAMSRRQNILKTLENYGCQKIPILRVKPVKVSASILFNLAEDKDCLITKIMTTEIWV